MAIANVEMTGKWEAELAKIERGEASADGSPIVSKVIPVKSLRNC